MRESKALSETVGPTVRPRGPVSMSAILTGVGHTHKEYICVETWEDLDAGSNQLQSPLRIDLHHRHLATQPSSMCS